MLKKKIVRITSLAASIAFIWLCVLPVSASENIPLLDWSWGYYITNRPTATTLPTSFVPSSAADVFGGNAGRVVMYGFGIPAESGYTYTFTNTFQLRGEFTKPNLCSDDVLSTLNYTYSPFGTDKLTFAGKIQNQMVSVSRDADGNCVLKVVFNTDNSHLTPGDIYLYANMFYYSVASGSTTIGATIGNEILVCLKDLDGTKFEQILIDEIAKMRTSQDEYFSNALEVLDQIKANGDEANTKLDQMPGKIGEELDKHDDKLKQEASTEGNDNVSQATSALTNALPIASISDAISPLITACSYNGITSVWSFPGIKIPAIAGLFDEMQLAEVQNFDLCAYAQDYIPEDLLQVIRAIMTILLIVWAVREVQGLLSHLLGGGDG